MREIETRQRGYYPTEIQTPLQYVADFALEARRAKNRVWVQCMDFEMGHAPGIVQNALAETGARGVDTRLTIDGFAVAMVNDQVSWIPKSGRRKDTQEYLQRADKDMFARLESSGVEVTVTNPHILNVFPAKIFPFVGRNHVKLTIVDDTAWFGGVNIASDHFEKADFMVKITDPELVHALGQVFFQVNEDKPKKDYRIDVDARNAIYVDRGDRGKSIILDEAQRMLHRVHESIDFISQFPPSATVLDAMVERAKEGVDVHIITQSKRHLESNSIPFGLLMKRNYQKFLKKTEGVSNVYVDHFEGHHGRVHAKMLIVDGREALWGSHNLDIAGVRAGTQEVDIKTTDLQLVRKLSAVFDQIKNGTFDLGFQEGPFNPQEFK
ncbi:MAG: phospholipase D-like domain-containing protein [Candidatus Levyibacteriota bacterium]